jgi:hypothetical protein
MDSNAFQLHLATMPAIDDILRVHDTLGGRVGWYNASRWLHTNHGGSHARSHYAQGSS